MRILIPFARYTRYIGRRCTARQGMTRSDDRATVPDVISIRVLVGDASRMASQLIAAQMRNSRSPRFETILPSCFNSKTIADEIISTRPDVALVSGALQDS